MRKQHESEVGMPLESCISCRSLWFEKDKIRLALQVSHLGHTSPEDHIGFTCPGCESGELSNYHMDNVEVPIISCPKCLGAWVDGGKFAAIKAAVKAAGAVKPLNENANPHLTVNVPVNHMPPPRERDWLMTVAILLFLVGAAFFIYVVLKR